MKNSPLKRKNKVDLSDGDAAIILRKDGTIQVYVPPTKDNSMLPNSSNITAACAISMLLSNGLENSHEICQLIMGKFMAKMSDEQKEAK